MKRCAHRLKGSLVRRASITSACRVICFVRQRHHIAAVEAAGIHRVLEYEGNHPRSALSRVRRIQAGNWYTVEQRPLARLDAEARQRTGENHGRALNSAVVDQQRIFDLKEGGPSAGLDLTGDQSYASLVNQPTSSGCMQVVPDSVRVVPFDPMSSMLWLKTLPDDGRCNAPMPRGTQGLGVIAPDEFAILEAWISGGAQNN